jgi:ATP-dependent Clp protease ATP-binding subunit ClpX
MIPELLGRLPVIATLDPLEEDELVRVLKEPRDALVKQYAKLFSLNGTSLRFTPDALREIARLAIERETGARALRSILEDVMLDALFELPNHQGRLKEFVVNKSAVEKKTFAAGKKTWAEEETGKKKMGDNDQGHRKTA